MSGSFRSRKTSNPLSTNDTTASGPDAAHSSRPTFTTANQGFSSSANRGAATRLSTGRARARRSRTAMDGSCQVGDASDVVTYAPAAQLFENAGASPGIGESRCAHLHGVGPCHQQLNGILAGRNAADADDR